MTTEGEVKYYVSVRGSHAGYAWELWRTDQEGKSKIVEDGWETTAQKARRVGESYMRTQEGN